MSHKHEEKKSHRETSLISSTQVALRRCRLLAQHLRDAVAVESSNLRDNTHESTDENWSEEQLRSSTERKWNGWGYKDTKIYLNPDGFTELSGKRYAEVFPSKRVIPKLREWAETFIGVDVTQESLANVDYPQIDEPVISEAFLESIQRLHLKMSMEKAERIEHSHGHTCMEIYELRYSKKLGRVPDVVVWPTCHDQVEALVSLAVQHNVCLIPYGGGTSVSNALECSANEKRMIASLDMRDMNRIKWVDKENMMACVEAGMVGLDLHNQLRNRGVTMGHEPDSWEFSTVGGWVSTRASGMKKNTYGNIEDMVVNITLVTPSGTIQKASNAPRVSLGPDMMQVILGSEGMFGVITEVTLRIRKLPEVQIYDSLLFPTFESGVQAMHEIARARCQPASIRLMDNTQFLLGQALKPQSATPFRSQVLDHAKKAFVTMYKGFEVSSMCAATLLFEGRQSEVVLQQSQIYTIAKKHGAMVGGAENGSRGYFLTYIIAYLRDFAFDYCFLSESFETSLPWSNVIQLCRDVTKDVNEEACKHGVVTKPLVCCRVTQVYETGACVYVYFGMITRGLKDPKFVFHCIENRAIEAVVKNGAALSHHHGIGKHRKAWLPQAISNTSVATLRSIKQSLDPQNIFGVQNLLE